MIDVHLHAVALAELYEDDPGMQHAARDVFSVFFSPQPIATQLREMDESGVERSVVLPLDCTTAHGCTIGRNEHVAALAQREERLIGFASVDPRREDAIEQLDRAVEELGLRGLSLDPALQQFDLDDDQTTLPLLRRCAELGVPVIVQCGLNWAIKARCALGHPLALERAVSELPTLKVVIGQCGFPWVADALLLALKYPNVYLDTAIIYSGTPGDSVRRVLAHDIGLDVVERSLHSQIVFGSGSPRVTTKRVAAGIRQLGLSPSVFERVASTNALALLGAERIAA